MDFELRQLLREAQAAGDIYSEIKYLNALLRAGQLTRKQVELASYLGHLAASQMQPYDTPYVIARLSGYPEPKPPKTNWFCEPVHGIDKPPHPDDIADLWAVNLSFEYTTEVLTAALLLTLKFLINNTHQLFGAVDFYYMKRELVKIYEKLCQAVMPQLKKDLTVLDDEILHLFAAQLPLSVYQYYHDIMSNILWYINTDCKDPNSMHFAKDAFRLALDLTLHSALGEDLCQYLSTTLPPFILGYESLEEILDLEN